MTFALRSFSIAAILWSVMMATVVSGQNKSNPTPQVPDDLDPHVKVLQPGVRLELLAEHPLLVTPTGIDVDASGRIWLVACHTHFRPEAYVGPEHDEILWFDPLGKRQGCFYQKTDATMQLKLGPDGWVYLAERDRILRVKDTDGDGVGDREENLAVLDTVADYPHNGLSGMAWHPDGGLVFSLGENFGKDWVLTGTDGSQVKGRGEGGVFRCDAEGKQLRRMAQGFWNPFGLLVRDDGEIFAAENDPGSRPPCRLLHVVQGADYGFQWVYGSSPIHPFIAWNGELRGTLGMVHPCGEGPCAVVELGGGVMIPSWSNHCIDYFPLHRKGASFQSQRIELLRGSDHFRPVAMAKGPDGAFYLTDWVFSSYQVHGRGRLWKLTIDRASATWMQKERDPENEAAARANGLRTGTLTLPVPELLHLAAGEDPYLSDAALTALSRQSSEWKAEWIAALPAEQRVWAVVALRRQSANDATWPRQFLEDPDREVRFEALRWICDHVLTEFTQDVEKRLERDDLEYREFEAALATWNTLRGNPGAGVTDPPTLIDRLTNPTVPNRVKGFVLRLIPPNHPRMKSDLLADLLNQDHPELQREVVRTLALRSDEPAWQALSTFAVDDSKPTQDRCDAIAGLSGSTRAEDLDRLIKLTSHRDPSIRSEALRALRSRTLAPESSARLKAIATVEKDFPDLLAALLEPQTLTRDRPAFESTEAWQSRLDQIPRPGDPRAGRRIFFHRAIAQCANCHRFQGRGNVVGPDLSLIANQGDRANLLRAILEPHRDVAPQFYTTALQLADGSVFTGILLRSSNTEVYRDSIGNERTFQKQEIESRTELKTSLMPIGLVHQLTDGELKDLLAFLMNPAD